MDLIYYYLPALETVRDFLEMGGGVLYVIGMLTMFMWALIIERLVYLRMGHKRLVASAQQLWESRSDHSSWNAHQIRERLVSQVSAQVERNIPMIQTCVALCPLLGLLGTVTGMIEVFEVMAISGSSSPRSMAAGVSKASPTSRQMITSNPAAANRSAHTVAKAPMGNTSAMGVARAIIPSNN